MDHEDLKKAVNFRSACPVAGGLDVIGDKWTVIIVRDLALGATRYSDFLSSPEGITTNILADRLKMMESIGLVTKEAYQEKPTRYAYRLTDMGRGLVPVMRALKEWSLEWLPGRSTRVPGGLAWEVRREIRDSMNGAGVLGVEGAGGDRNP